MRLVGPEFIDCDVLVIGGGGAGLRAAIQARERGASVVLASKSLVGLGNNTAISKASFAAVAGHGDPHDSPETHLKDTLEAGRYINDRRLVERLVHQIAGEVAFLQKCGVDFQSNEGKLSIGAAPGHSYPRNVQTTKRMGTDYTTLLREYAARQGVRLMGHIFITRLLKQAGQVVGAAGFDSEGHFLVFSAKSTVLATGGLGKMFLRTNNAAGTTGDGFALAFRAGVPLRDMEFIQFYPTTLGGGTPMVLYEVFVMRGYAIIRNARGEDVVQKHGLQDPMKMTRDRLTRAVYREIMDGNGVEGGVIMDYSPAKEETLTKLRVLVPPAALEGQKEFIVAPAVHFVMGGVITDAEARTPLPGLFACGEVVGGMHGANRLAGNALAEVFAMGGVAGDNAALAAKNAPVIKPGAAMIAAERKKLESRLDAGGEDPADLIRALKKITWNKVGIIRERSELDDALKGIKELASRAGNTGAKDPKGLSACLELDNMLLVAEMIARSALERQESRGAHFRDDYPQEDPAWVASLRINNQRGKIVLEKKPVS